MTPDILLVGHIVKAIVSDGWRPGGSILFAAQQSKRLGLAVGAVTACSPDVSPLSLVPDLPWSGRQDSEGVSFENTYTDGHREQRILGNTSSLQLADIPSAWRGAALILLAPLFHDVEPSLVKQLAGPEKTVACLAQGWLRIRQDGRIRPAHAPEDPDWSGYDVVFVSEEDLVNPEAVVSWQTQFPVIVLTRSEQGCTIWAQGNRLDLPALPADAVDPTGAGDVFATAFLVEYQKTNDPLAAGQFAAAAAALSVEGSGLDGIANHSEIEARLAARPVVRP